MDLIFMHEISNLMTSCSKEFQRFDVLPFHVLTAYETLNAMPKKAKDSIAESHQELSQLALIL